ncbi:hypothetical protein GCHA_0148 [Paraglaciecola chathamensis S18K6]|uniref:Uncharacterized protein n=1 Tax=Paraglaciecola chathamensis S18K6 TaxID=1127672 RepID=A0AAV3USV8_9ALTE|nr:hypothetical protein GCHA_0148 [Paraglaciecola chathamensis S18K6]
MALGKSTIKVFPQSNKYILLTSLPVDIINCVVNTLELAVSLPD